MGRNVYRFKILKLKFKNEMITKQVRFWLLVLQMTEHLSFDFFLPLMCENSFSNKLLFHFMICLGKYTPQYEWLEAELPKVNRSETPWLIVLMHSPWYNSYNYHYMEGETMRVMYESWFVQYKVDVVFAGHVHAYERSVSAFS